MNRAMKRVMAPPKGMSVKKALAPGIAKRGNKKLKSLFQNWR